MKRAQARLQRDIRATMQLYGLMLQTLSYGIVRRYKVYCHGPKERDIGVGCFVDFATNRGFDIMRNGYSVSIGYIYYDFVINSEVVNEAQTP
jgi:hypothetical protein